MQQRSRLAASQEVAAHSEPQKIDRFLRNAFLDKTQFATGVRCNWLEGGPIELPR